MSDGELFTVRINDGAAYEFKAGTGMYQYAALAAVLSNDELLPLPKAGSPIHVEIWCERLLPQYGPYTYLVWEETFGRIVVATASPTGPETPRLSR